MGKIVLTCVLALVFGFAGAAGAVVVFQGQMKGPQGPTGLTGAPGPAGDAGQDGIDGKDGKPGPRGKPGKAGKAAANVNVPSDLGVTGCSGKSVQVVSGGTITKAQKLKLTTKTICIVKPAKSTSP
jgi:hypothetical protein